MKALRYSCATAVLTAAVGFSQMASAVPILSFIVDGDTAFESFSITNGSTTGEMVTAFHLDITSTGNCFDVTDLRADACPGNAANGLQEFAAQENSDVITGLMPPSVNDGDTVLDFIFNDFDPGESFIWDLDIDEVGAGRIGTVLGNQLIGATAWVDFSNGDRLYGTLDAVQNNPDASQFVVIGKTRLPPDPDPNPDPDPVPLPSTVSLLALAMLGLRLRMRKPSR